MRENFHLTGRIEAFEGDKLVFERDFDGDDCARPYLTRPRDWSKRAIRITPRDVAIGLADGASVAANIPVTTNNKNDTGHYQQSEEPHHVE